MEKDLKLSEDYELALSELKERGQIIKTFINNNGESFFKVSIELMVRHILLRMKI